MSQTPPPADTPEKAGKPAPKPRRRLGLRIAAWTVGAVVAIGALVALAVVGIDTDTGHRLLVDMARKTAMANGLKIGVGRIDGSIYRRMTIRDLTLSDPKGAFLTSPGVTLDWRPMELLHKHVLVEEVSADSIHVLRAPVLKPGPPPKPNQPTLPDLYATVNRLHVGALVLEPALTGDRRSLGVDGSMQLLHGSAKVDLAAQAQAIDGHAGGDRLTLKLDAAPDQNRLTVDAHLAAPKGGVVDRLAKLNADLNFDLDGHGDWRAWDGHAQAMLGGKPLIEAGVSERNGLFAAKGQASPGVIVKGPPADLTAPALAFDLSGKLQDRQLDANAHLSSAALDLTAAGRLDLARSRFAGLRVNLKLLKPEAASPMLNGRNLRAALTLDGAFVQPTIDYDIAADRIGFDRTVIENLHASGKARVDAGATLHLPVHATAGRVLGLDPSVGGLVDNMKIDGDLAVSAKQIASDNLRLRSDRLDATLVMALSLDTGRYDAVLKGRINRYAIKGLGVVDVVTDAKLVPTGKGVFRIAGHIHGQTLRLDNPSAAEFLGGNAVVDADFSRTPSGAFGVANLRLTAPKFRILGGQGTYGADGRIAFTASAVSQPYGSVRLDVGGTVAAPVVKLHSPSLNVGTALTNLDVQLKGTGSNAYLVNATGGTPYGSFSAEVALHTAPGALSADIHRASLAGFTLAGQARQTPEGPFAGLLTLSGSGFNGTIRLAAADKVQRVDAALRASNARLPLTPAVTIAQGVINAAVLLYPNAPQITADATLSGVRQGALLVANAKAKANLRGQSGTVEISADGQSGVPFAIAANAGLSPDLIRVNGQGSVNHIALRLANAAEIRKTAGGYALAPTTVTLPQGRVDISGAFGDQTHGQVKLDNLDLSIAQAFAPSLDINGKASGLLTFDLPKGGAMPTGRADLAVTGFTRTSLTAVSEPVDVTVLANMTTAGADAHALIRRRGAVIGRLQANLGPPEGGAAPWLDRLRTAPLSGGVRFNGPSEALWALSGISGQELSGPIAIGADISGRLEAPKVTGVVRAQALRYANAAFGTVIDQIAVDGRFVDTRFDLTKLSARAGRGTIMATGYADMSAASGFPIELRVQFANAQLAHSEDIDATIGGNLTIANTKADGASVKGQLNVSDANYQIVRQAAADISDLQGVRRKGQLVAEAPPLGQVAASGPPSVWKLDIAVRAADRLFVRGMGLEAEWSSDLKITGDAAHPVVVGDIDLVRGVFSFAGTDLTLSRGVIHLDGSPTPDPTLDIEASTTTSDNVTATIDITGTAQAPQITFSSTPTLPQDEILSRLLFGSSIIQLTPIQAVQLAAALNSLRGSGGGLNPMGKLRNAAGLDRLRFYGADQATGRGPSVGAGKYIAKNIYVEITTDARGFTATQIEVALTRTLRLLSQVSSFGTSSLTVLYSLKY